MKVFNFFNSKQRNIEKQIAFIKNRAQCSSLKQLVKLYQDLFIHKRAKDFETKHKIKLSSKDRNFLTNELKKIIINRIVIYLSTDYDRLLMFTVENNNTNHKINVTFAAMKKVDQLKAIITQEENPEEALIKLNYFSALYECLFKETITSYLEMTKKELIFSRISRHSAIGDEFIHEYKKISENESKNLTLIKFHRIKKFIQKVYNGEAKNSLKELFDFLSNLKSIISNGMNRLLGIILNLVPESVEKSTIINFIKENGVPNEKLVIM